MIVVHDQPMTSDLRARLRETANALKPVRCRVHRSRLDIVNSLLTRRRYSRQTRSHILMAARIVSANERSRHEVLRGLPELLPMRVLWRQLP